MASCFIEVRLHTAFLLTLHLISYPAGLWALLVFSLCSP
uniref:Uncharacterized protein n=1 Tax=Anguilla anguilla TaxID=7936 RepID=A0A0E9W6H9_ANGAN